MEVAAGDGKLIKLSLIYPSPGGRPTHGISRSSIFVVTLHPLFATSLSPSTISPAIYPSHFSCFYLSRSDSGAPRMRDLKQLKRSAKHFNLTSGAFMPRARAHTLIYISLFPRPSTYPILPLCIPRPIRSTPGRRRGGSETRVLPPLVERTEVKGGSGE